jgi:hypothetical protein
MQDLRDDIFYTRILTAIWKSLDDPTPEPTEATRRSFVGIGQGTLN